MALIEYEQVRQQIGASRSHLLLGNGFSIACDPIFAYPSLYDRAVQLGLSVRAQRVFERLGTNNFEGAMRLLLDSHWVGRTYGLVPSETSPMLEDVEVTKRALIQAIAETHPAHAALIPDNKKHSARLFFGPYYNVFTTNYDLLAYWVVMAREGGPIYRDGFGDDPDEPDAPHVVFSFHVGDQRGLYYLHGGLHLFTDAGNTAKHCWSRTNEHLTTLIRNSMVANRLPLFVAEGTAAKKLEQIQQNSYLSYPLSKLSRVGGHLVVFGSSLADSDAHIRRAIALNPKFEGLYLSVLNPEDTTAADAAAMAINAIREDRGLAPLPICLFTAGSAHVWDAAPEQSAPERAFGVTRMARVGRRERPGAGSGRRIA